ncbi:putative serine/threonine protein kinase IRE [Tasmannia lanceolata]|uniref:putative serine/threonine protein kinase IRE n=1 Tax=Tasmannia lanceolata TaxID=3420 RepID=UPI0040642BD9
MTPSQSGDASARGGNGNSNVSDPVAPQPVQEKETTTITRSKLRKIPRIPIRRDSASEVQNLEKEESSKRDREDGMEPGHGNSSPILASSLGLNHIRTRSQPSPLRFSSSTTPTPSDPDNGRSKHKDGDARPIGHSLAFPPYDPLLAKQGKKSPWFQSKSFRGPFPNHSEMEEHHAAFDTAKEIQSPRFQAILRVTSGRRKRSPADVKSFSHELNSKGVRPFPLWKPRGLSHPEAIMVVVRAKFDRLKEEVDSDLAFFAVYLVDILEKHSEGHPEWNETLEDLLLVARDCAKLSSSEFWSKCESIVQKLDDRRQELSTGILKQVHTRILFILTRCTRLLQFQKEVGLTEDEHILGLHQLSDLGVYLDKGSGDAHAGLKSLSGKDMRTKHTRKSHMQGQNSSDMNQDHFGHHIHQSDGETAKSNDSPASRDRMSSWKKFPSATEKNQKLDTLQPISKTEMDSNENTNYLNRPACNSGHLSNLSDPSLSPLKASLGHWRDQQNLADENAIICRICEVEVPTVHVEDHSTICTIADRCDLKILGVNERLERVAETLERILESCTAERSDSEGVGSPEVTKSSTSSITEDYDDLSPNKNNLAHSYSEDIIDCLPEANSSLSFDDLKGFPSLSCKINCVPITDQHVSDSSVASMTPRSPLLTPRTSQIELLLSGRSTITEYESFQQIHDLLNIARYIASVNTNDKGSLRYLLSSLEVLQNVVQDRKVDALIVETFGRRIEKLLREKYLQLMKMVDGTVDSSTMTFDEDGSVEDTACCVQASPINSNLKDQKSIENVEILKPTSRDRTSIEDFEIIKPISRGAFGRVFLARKRITGDLFAIKVLKKADMIRKKAVESILAERNILISVRNPFVVRFFYSFTCRENLYLVMEYLNGGDLYSLLRNLGCLDEEMARVYIAEVVLALEYLHSLNVVHHDLKPDNLLIAHDGHIKLTDFGLSKVGLINCTDDLSGPAVSGTTLIVDDDELRQSSTPQMQKREERQKHSAVGTPDYLAPEILLGMGHGTTADWWSVGIILFELLVGIPPFNAGHPQQIFDNIMNRDIPWPQVPEVMSHEAYDLISKLLIENPVQRLGATGAGEVKRHAFFKNINWDTLARQKAAFIPSAEDAYDTSYFTSRYVWNPAEDGHEAPDVADDFEDMSDTCSSSCSCSTASFLQDEDGDECGNLADFGAATLSVKYSFSNFSFKNLSQLASINYDVLLKSSKDVPKTSKPP